MPATTPRPFAVTSLWNTPIDPSRVHYTNASRVENIQLHDRSLANTWIFVEDVMDDRVLPARSAVWTFDVFNNAGAGGLFSTHGSLSLATPTDLDFVHGGDGWSIFFDPDGVHYYETWGGSFNAVTGVYHASYLVKGDLAAGSGFGANGAGAGIRASGAALLGGVVTSEELAALSIPHALSIELASGQLKAGATPRDQFVFPAVAADGDSVASYTGLIPMGAHFAIPKSLDLSQAGLSPLGLALAVAYQTYGGYVVDRAGQTTSLAEIDLGEHEGPAIAADLWRDIDWIRDHLVMIESVTPATQFRHCDGSRVAPPGTAHSGARSDAQAGAAAAPEGNSSDRHAAESAWQTVNPLEHDHGWLLL